MAHHDVHSASGHKKRGGRRTAAAAAAAAAAACCDEAACCPAAEVVCCDDANCARPVAKDCCFDVKPRRATKSSARRTIAAVCVLVACVCALCLVPGVAAGGNHGGGDLRPGFVECHMDGDEEHCEEDTVALAAHCAEVDPLEDYNLNLHIGAVFIQIGVSLIGCLIPLAAKKWKALQVSDYTFSLFKHFGAGIILSTGFIHMLPPAFGYLTNICLSDTWLTYPFAGLFAMLAIMFTQLVQTMAVSYLRIFDSPKTAIKSGAVSSEMEKAPVAAGPTQDKGELILDTRTDAEKDLAAHASTPHHGHDHGHPSAADLDDVEHTHNLLLAHKQRRQVTLYILEVGIATHSFIIGMALGVASGSEVTSLMIALAFHQLFEGMALSATALDAGFKTLFQPIFIIAAYSLTTPLGIAVGIAIHSSFTANSPSTLIALGIIDSIAAGILIYDACVNLIHANMTSSPSFIKMSTGKKALAFAVLWVAVGLMSLIGLWA